MKEKHLTARYLQALAISKCSSCLRRKVGTVIIEPKRNVVVADAYNGNTRDGSKLCGGDHCLRDKQDLQSGQSNDVGCLHAEAGAICNAAAQGTATAGAWMLVTIPPCINCAKLIHHCGIKKVIIGDPGSGYCEDGLSYLIVNGVEIVYLKNTSFDVDEHKLDMYV
jgi:dCMP deaminase